MPDVFILGFTKCATTSIYNQLMQHDDVSHTRHKEPHFHFAQIMGQRFAGPADNDTVRQMFVTGLEQYKALYEPDKLSIDGSAMSTTDPRIVEKIDAQYPHARYIIMLRDPVERAFSAYSHLIRDARETRSFREAIDHELSGARKNYMPIWHYIKPSRYVEVVQHARKLLGERLKVVSYHDYAQDNQATMDEIARFIGLSSIVWRRDHANRSGVPRSKLLQKILMRGSLAKTAFVRFSPRGFVTSSKRYLMERNTGAKYRLKDEDRSWFQACVADELDKIEADTMDCEMLTSLYSK